RNRDERVDRCPALDSRPRAWNYHSPDIREDQLEPRVDRGRQATDLPVEYRPHEPGWDARVGGRGRQRPARHVDGRRRGAFTDVRVAGREARHRRPVPEGRRGRTTGGAPGGGGQTRTR